MVAPRSEGLLAYDGAACRTPLLLCASPSATHRRSQSLQEPAPLIVLLRQPRAEGSGQGRFGSVTSGKGSEGRLRAKSGDALFFLEVRVVVGDAPRRQKYSPLPPALAHLGPPVKNGGLVGAVLWWRCFVNRKDSHRASVVPADQGERSGVVTLHVKTVNPTATTTRITKARIA